MQSFLLYALLIDHIARNIVADNTIENDTEKQTRLEQAIVMIPGVLLSKAKEVVAKETVAPYSKALADQLILATQTRRVKELRTAKKAIEQIKGKIVRAVR